MDFNNELKDIKITPSGRYIHFNYAGSSPKMIHVSQVKKLLENYSKANKNNFFSFSYFKVYNRNGSVWNNYLVYKRWDGNLGIGCQRINKRKISVIKRLLKIK